MIKNNAKLRDGTEIVVQTCKSEDHVTEKSLLIVVRRFRENDLVLEPKVEIAIDKTATVQDLENKLKKLSGLSDIVMAKPFPEIRPRRNSMPKPGKNMSGNPTKKQTTCSNMAKSCPE